MRRMVIGLFLAFNEHEYTVRLVAIVAIICFTVVLCTVIGRNR